MSERLQPKEEPLNVCDEIGGCDEGECGGQAHHRGSPRW
jgi:hypothetical protein